MLKINVRNTVSEKKAKKCQTILKCIEPAANHTMKFFARAEQSVVSLNVTT